MSPSVEFGDHRLLRHLATSPADSPTAGIASGPGTSYLLNDNKTSLGLPKRHVIGANGEVFAGIGVPRTRTHRGPRRTSQPDAIPAWTRRWSCSRPDPSESDARLRESGEGVQRTTDLDTLTARCR